MTDDQLVHIFQLMDSQRHLPNYKLARLRLRPTRHGKFAERH